MIVASFALFVAATTPPPPPPLPVIELRRTSVASHFDPGRSSSPLFVLVIGSDVREGDPKGGRADSLHLVALNPDTGRGTIVGIPRDSYVPIPGLGASKINAALVRGGPERMVQTVSQLAGVPIHYWALTEFSRFRQLVDAVGGVEIDVPYAMADSASGAFFDPGRRKMNGAEALAFSRNRKSVPGGDFERSRNQGRLLLASLAQFRRDAASPLRLASYLLAFNRFVETNVPMGELLKLAAVGRRIDPARVENLVLPGGGGSAGGASVVLLAPDAQEIFAAIRDDGVR
jgi:polyisoprenyl-teichoic acid--peptidoglycan teichoic acid transferase